MGLFARLTATRRHARRLARPTHRRARLEPLEERRLLSVASADQGPEEYALGVGDVQSTLESPFDAGSDAALAASQEGPDLVLPPWAFIELPDGRYLSEVVNFNLARLHYEYEAFIAGGGQPDDFVPSDADLHLFGNRVTVRILADEPVRWEEVDRFGDVVEVVNEGFIDELEAIGLEVIALGSNTIDCTLDALLPFDAIYELATLEGIGAVYATTPLTHGDDTEPVDSEGPELLLPPWLLIELPDGRRLASIVGSNLARLHYEYEAFIHAGGQAADFTASDGALSIVDDRVGVDVFAVEPVTYVEVIDGEAVEVENAAFISQLESLGFIVTAKHGYAVGGLLPFDAIDDIAALTGVRRVGAAYAVTSVGETDTQDASSESVIPGQVYVGIWTDTRVSDMQAYVRTLNWPDTIAPLTSDNVWVGATRPFSEGGFRTRAVLPLRTDVDVMDAVEDLEGLSWVLSAEPVRLFQPEDGSPVAPAVEPSSASLIPDERIIQGIVPDVQDVAQPVPLSTEAGSVRPEASASDLPHYYYQDLELIIPGEVIVGFRTNEPIADVGAYVETLDWPASLDRITAADVKKVYTWPQDQNEGFSTHVLLTLDWAIDDFDPDSRIPPDSAARMAGDLTLDLVAQLRGLPFIDSAEPNRLLKVEPLGDPVFIALPPNEPPFVPLTILPSSSAGQDHDGSVVPGVVLVGLRTDEPVADPGGYVAGLDWPDFVRPVTADSVRLGTGTQVPDGGFLIRLRIELQENVDVFDAAEQLSQLDWVWYAEPDHYEQPAVIALEPPWPSGGEVVPGQLVVSFRTTERIEDVGAYVESLEWPAWLGPITAESVLRSSSHLAADGQYATLLRLSYDGVVPPREAASLLKTVPFVYNASPLMVVGLDGDIANDPVPVPGEPLPPDATGSLPASAEEEDTAGQASSATQPSLQESTLPRLNPDSPREPWVNPPLQATDQPELNPDSPREPWVNPPLQPPNEPELNPDSPREPWVNPPLQATNEPEVNPDSPRGPFVWVLGYGSDDSQVDTAEFYDTTADLGTSYATRFNAENGYSELYEGTVFYVNAADFDQVSAAAVGDDDTAKLYDSALDDVYWSRPDHSRMEYADGTYVEALDFRYALAYSENGGDDTATLYDETAGSTSYAARFWGYATWSKLYSGTSFYSKTEGFAEVRAALRGDDDLAWVYDDPTRVDHLVVPFPGPAAAKAQLWNDQRAIYIDDFYELTATTSQSFVDDKDIDPAYEDDVILVGDCAEA